jgi:hypothetical protein
MVEKTISSEESISTSILAFQRFSKKLEAVVQENVNECLPSSKMVYSRLNSFTLLQSSVHLELLALLDQWNLSGLQDAEFEKELNALVSLFLKPFTYLAWIASQGQTSLDMDSFVTQQAYSRICKLHEDSQSAFRLVKQLRKKATESIGVNPSTLLSIKTLFCDSKVSKEQGSVLSTLEQLGAELKSWIGGYTTYLAPNTAVPIWIIKSNELQEKLDSSKKLQLKLKEAETKALSQIQKTAEKIEEIGQLQVCIEKLEKRLNDSDSVHDEIKKLQKDLLDMTELKEKYEKGLEMMHADFEESNQEYDILSKQYEALQQHLKQRSPLRHNVPVSRGLDVPMVEVIHSNIGKYKIIYDSISIKR